MKRIITSLIILVGALSALSIGSTGAFFSDTETSTGNIFTAGSIDLKIDHSLSSYNGNAVVNDLIIVSDPQTTFSGGPPVISGNAVNLTFVHPVWETISGANWIWATDPVSDPAGPVNQSYTFTRTFVWNGPVTNASIDFGADNYYDVSVNGNFVGSNHSLVMSNFQSPHTTDVTPFIVQGINTITFVGENQHIDGSVATGNPAGIIFKLVIHGQQLFPDPVDLTGLPFWNFTDVKPADQGREVFSLHVGSNDAWACMVLNNVKNNENTLIEPESSSGDVTPGIAGVGDGELGNYLNLFLWRDVNGDGVYNPPTETILSQGLIGNGLPLAIHDSTTANGALVANISENVGVVWCLGQITADPGTGVIICNGSEASNPNINQSQTDSAIADLTFYATQQRNQPTFKCSDLQL